MLYISVSQTFSAWRPLGFQINSQRPLDFQLDSQRALASFLSEKNVRQRIFICNFAIFLPNFWCSLKKKKKRSSL